MSEAVKMFSVIDEDNVIIGVFHFIDHAKRFAKNCAGENVVKEVYVVPVDECTHMLEHFSHRPPDDVIKFKEPKG